MPTRAILIDDEPLARQIVREFLRDFPQVEIIAECENGRQAVAALNRHKPDLVFLDVQMPVLNGFEVLEQLEHVPNIIFSTAYDDYAIRAFEVNAVDYLLKPYDRMRFAAAVQRAFARNAMAPAAVNAEMERLLRLLQYAQKKETLADRLLLRSGERILPLRIADIDWVEAADDYTVLHVGGSRHLSSLGLGELEKRLPAHQFLRVHRSAIINVTRIKHLEKDGEGGMLAMLMNGEKVKISRKYAAALRALTC